MKPRGLFKRVFDFARAELERRARSSDEPEPHDREPSRPLEPRAGDGAPAARPEPYGLEVVRTEDAGIHLAWSISQAEVDRARALFGARPASPRSGAPADPRAAAGPRVDARGSAREQSTDSRAAGFDPDAVLCVRVVAFTPTRDDVLRRVQDRPGVELRGECDVGMVDGRALVSIGLRSGERFVSIVHHTV
jgi:hypothetical protein